MTGTCSRQCWCNDFGLCCMRGKENASLGMCNRELKCSMKISEEGVQVQQLTVRLWAQINAMVIQMWWRATFGWLHTTRQDTFWHTSQIRQSIGQKTGCARSCSAMHGCSWIVPFMKSVDVDPFPARGCLLLSEA